MRIISGKARGLRIQPPSGKGVRPTADRVKESLFSMLGPVVDLTVIDLFAGTGALGLEALSRGAREVVFIENNRRHMRLLQANLARLRKSLGDESGRADVICMSAQRVPSALARLQHAVDIVLADPPYRPAPGAFGAQDLLCSEAFSSWAGDALLVLEHASDFTWPPASRWRMLKHRTYGNTTLTFCRNSSEY